MNWNKRMKEARENAGITRLSLAKSVGVSPPTVTDWESGEIKKIDGENLLKAAATLNVSAEWIMFGTKRKSTTSDQAKAVAEAFDQLTDVAQKDAIVAMLRAWGVLK
jgi:transcriptional regulator with XRE-family HTH domain